MTLFENCRENTLLYVEMHFCLKKFNFAKANYNLGPFNVLENFYTQFETMNKDKLLESELVLRQIKRTVTTLKDLNTTQE